ncbi:MAG TPA: hypothetical protein DCS48_02410 [Desulfovibrio sp.]|nr:hypothetical protein [Desulfovibrio sp.]
MPLCEFCGEPLPKGRVKFCGYKCLHGIQKPKPKTKPKPKFKPLATVESNKKKRAIGGLDPWGSLEFTSDTPAPNSAMFNPLG